MLIIYVTEVIMPRPRNPREIFFNPRARLFKPAGIPGSELEHVVLTMDEMEALRLADFEGLYHEAAAENMKISRQTFGRVIKNARAKVADALVNGKAIRVEGGSFVTPEQREFICDDCENTWVVPFGGGRPRECPDCSGGNVMRNRAALGRNGRGRKGRGGRGRGGGRGRR